MTIKVVTSSGIAKGKLESVEFPIKAQIDKYGAWSATVINTGETGIFGLGIVNVIGNPGSITLKVSEEEAIISPNQYMRYSYTDAKPNGTKLIINGEVKYPLVGTYTIKVWAMHLEDEGWYYDEEIIFTISVVEELVESTFLEKLRAYAKENPTSVAVAVGVIVGGALVWQTKQKES